jgi:hypothetical protein
LHDRLLALEGDVRIVALAEGAIAVAGEQVADLTPPGARFANSLPSAMAALRIAASRIADAFSAPIAATISR